MSAIIQASTLEKLSREPLPTGDSCVLIIFGASGDLTKRKLINRGGSCKVERHTRLQRVGMDRL
jgi:hypothetical protein